MAKDEMQHPEHAKQGADDRAHGTHGKGFMHEPLADEQASGSVVDRRPPDPDSGDERRHA